MHCRKPHRDDLARGAIVDIGAIPAHKDRIGAYRHQRAVVGDVAGRDIGRGEIVINHFACGAGAIVDQRHAFQDKNIVVPRGWHHHVRGVERGTGREIAIAQVVRSGGIVKNAVCRLAQSDPNWIGPEIETI